MEGGGLGLKSRCDLCPRLCRVDRAAGEVGWCGAGPLPRVARAALHHWEEPPLSGERGSGTIFFSGCNMRCAFCQNHVISTRPEAGRAVDAAALCAVMASLIEQGAHNVNLVSASHCATAVAEGLALARGRGVAGPRRPVVWNSNAYETVESLRRLDGLVDVYLPDLKYVDDALAVRYSAAPGYFAAATAAVREMVRQAGAPAFDEAGMIRRGVIVRHLVLPGRADDACRALEWLAAEFGGGVLVSVMAQYTPVHRASEFPELDRRVTTEEYQRAVDRAADLNLEGFFQEPSSASDAFIPTFEEC